MADLFYSYRNEIQSKLASGLATEHTYRPTLQNLLQELAGNAIAILNEAQQVRHNAPDFTIRQGGVPIGYIECKDLDADLDSIERSIQLRRYRKAFHNLILTDYLEFRWYVRGTRRAQLRLGIKQGSRIRRHRSHLSAATFFKGFFRPATVEINTPAELATQMAAKAQLIRETMVSIMAEESATTQGPFRAMCMKLQEELIPDLQDADFADIYAQSAAYGLFAARCLTYGDGRSVFSREHALGVPTTPLLHHLFSGIAGPFADPRLTWIVDDLVQLLAGEHFGDFLRDFTAEGIGKDPVVHFYERFLGEYDPQLRVQRGVFYTPRPVVQYIVRSIDSLLKTKLALPEGLADQQTVSYKPADEEQVQSSKVLILDPATGTGTFLREVIVHIRTNLESRGLAGAWPDFVQRHLLDRLIGFELLVTPYAICHLKLALELGRPPLPVALNIGQRFRVYLTDTLLEAAGKITSIFPADPVAAEALEAARAKSRVRIMVVLGNPPYSVESLNQGGWITGLIRGQRGGRFKADYYSVGGAAIDESNTRPLQDDYVKFIRYAQYKIDEAGEGVVGFVTNHAYLSNLTFRGMRESLLESFSDIYILNLHGNSNIRGASPHGNDSLSSASPGDVNDVNVFDIQQGVAIGLFVKRKDTTPAHGRVYYAELWGARSDKYDWLTNHDSSSTNWVEVKAEAPCYFFLPRSSPFADEYYRWHALGNSVLSLRSTSVVTCRNRITIHFTREELMRFLRRFVDLPPEEARPQLSIGRDTQSWKVAQAQRSIRETRLAAHHVRQILVRPYDVQYTYYTHKSNGFICRPRYAVMQHMVHGPNLGLITVRQTANRNYSLVFITDRICTYELMLNPGRSGANIFPVYSYHRDMGRQSNFCRPFVRLASERIGLDWNQDERGAKGSSFGAEDLLYYVYACLHSPEYRSRYHSELMTDFPRVPVTERADLFWRLVDIGDRLADLHLMRAFGTDLPGIPRQGTCTVDRRKYVDGRLWINKHQYFDGVDPDVWGFEQCAWRPLEIWLRSRKGRTLSSDDIIHFRRIHASVSETMQQMQRIDQVINEHGGWPLQ